MSNQNENLTTEELLLKIYKNTEKTRKYILWGRVMTVIYLLILVAPIILAVIYLPPLLEKTVEPYQELLQTSQSGSNILERVDLQELMKMYR